MYSVTPILAPYTNKQGLNAIVLQVIYGKIKTYPATGVKIKPGQWKNNSIIDHELKTQMNNQVKKKKLEVESILLNLNGKQVTAKQLTDLITGKKLSDSFIDFCAQYMEEMKFKFSVGRLKHYQVIYNKVEKFDKEVLLSAINTVWLQRFENWLHHQQIRSSTIKSNISIIKAIVRAAEDRNIIDHTNFKGYKNIKIVADEPEFLTEPELQAFFDVCRAIQKPGMKLAGYYFLLSCFTGFRITNAQKFNYKTAVRNDEIIIRASKGNKIVTIPIYKDLAEVLEYIYDKPLLLSQDKTRKYVKEIATLAGIKKHVKYHSSRHTAASRFLQKGLSLREVAELIGDTEAVTKIYSHIDKAALNKKIKELMN